MYKRTLSRVISKATKSFPILLVTGPQQVGKTTLLELCKTDKYRYITLDDLNLRILA